ncbi:RteC domain-containing protein [Chitinophaga sp. NPDC101104]|uniref:RteC domain-containing protein n=1 Tax=Chitinophaga sp. NPDC101104 TaxID=3390561 RepID=UPI003CFF7454
MTTTNPEELLAKLLHDISEIEKDGNHSIASFQEAARACNLTLRQLQAHADSHIFKHPDLEIYFFKHIKPAVEGRLLYFLKLLDLKGQFPYFIKEGINEFWQKRIESIHAYILRFGSIWKYFNTGATHLDATYFLRPKEVPITGYGSLRQLTTPGSETKASHAFARITAAIMLIDFCYEQLGKPDPSNDVSFTWTGTNQALTEVLYAFNELQVLDGKRHDITKVKAFFERVFNFKMGNVYKNWEHIRIRKKSRTAFFDEAIIALGKRADYDDLHALG